MKGNIKYALLDADFIIKTIIAQKEQGDHLLDLLMSDHQYSFVCHQMALEEVSRHDTCGASVWLRDAINTGKVKLYTDTDIASELCSFYGVGGIEYYKQFLQASCDSMNPDFYMRHYQALDEFDSQEGQEKFLSLLQKCDEEIGSSESLGERKAMVLLQTEQLFHSDNVYLFCSDDRKARAGLFSIAPVPCKSIMSVFWDFRKSGLDKTEAYKYFRPLEKYMTQGFTTTGNIRVLSEKGNEQLRIPCHQVFEEIYEDKFDSKITGFLQYNKNGKNA